MSMHLRGSRDMMGQNEEGWWKSRTGMEQMLLILSTVLFIIAFSLTIALIVAKNKPPPDCPSSTPAPSLPTGETETPSTDLSPGTVSEETSSVSETQPTELPISSSTVPPTSPSTVPPETTSVESTTGPSSEPPVPPPEEPKSEKGNAEESFPKFLLSTIGA